VYSLEDILWLLAWDKQWGDGLNKKAATPSGGFFETQFHGIRIENEFCFLDDSNNETWVAMESAKVWQFENHVEEVVRRNEEAIRIATERKRQALSDILASVDGNRNANLITALRKANRRK